MQTETQWIPFLKKKIKNHSSIRHLESVSNPEHLCLQLTCDWVTKDCMHTQSYFRQCTIHLALILSLFCEVLEMQLKIFHPWRKRQITQHLRGHFLTQKAPYVYLALWLCSSWKVVGLYTNVCGHCVTHAPLSLKFMQACKAREKKKITLIKSYSWLWFVLFF